MCIIIIGFRRSLSAYIQFQGGSFCSDQNELIGGGFLYLILHNFHQYVFYVYRFFSYLSRYTLSIMINDRIEN